MKKLILLVYILLPLSIFCQTTVSGVVTDANTGETLIGANVIIQGTNTGTATDFDGSYSLTIDNDAVLLISYTGYSDQTISVSNSGGQITQNIEMATDALQLDNVVVTAFKKAESVQDVPASISVLSPVELRRSGAREFKDYASSIPNLSFGTKGGQGALSDGRTSNQIAIRGIAGANTTALYLDETPLPANISPRLTDIARIEVLRGPQGTLYGSSSMGGAVRTITNQPNADRKEGSFSVSGATVEEGDLDYDVQGIINLPLSDKAAFRASAFYEFETGVYDQSINGEFLLNSVNPWTENAFGETTNFESGTPINIPTDGCAGCRTEGQENIDDERNYGFNASLGFYPTENISIIPRIIYQKQEGDGLDFADTSPDNFDQVRFAGLEENFEDEWTHYSLSVNIGLNSGRIVSSTSFTDRFYNEQEDVTDFLASLDLPWSSFITRQADYKKFVQEVRYQSELEGNVNFIAGVFYANEELNESGAEDAIGLTEWLGSENPMFWEPEFGGIPPFLWDIPFWRFSNDLEIEEFSLFGEVYVDLTERLTLTAGLRYFNATTTRQYNALGLPTDFEEVVTNADISENGFNPKINLNYKLSKNNLVYGTIARGFRLGGVNDPIPIAFCGDELASVGEDTPDNFESDDLWNFEVGYKGVLADGKVTLNAAVFHNAWSGIQQFRRLLCGFGFTANAGEAAITGLDLDLKAKLSKEFELGVGLGLLNPEITEGGPGLDAQEGNRILFTPTYTGAFNLKYFKSLNGNASLFGNLGWNFVGERFSTYAAQNDGTDREEVNFRTLDAYNLLNLRVGVAFANVEASIFANNLTGTAANFGDVVSLAAEVSGRPRYTTNRPRTIGLQLRTFF